MHDVVERYGSPPYNVKYWELGNEPDAAWQHIASDSVFGCWGDVNAPFYGGQHYGEMLKEVYPQIKSTDPDAHVVVGGLLLRERLWPIRHRCRICRSPRRSPQ